MQFDEDIIIINKSIYNSISIECLDVLVDTNDPKIHSHENHQNIRPFPLLTTWTTLGIWVGLALLWRHQDLLLLLGDRVEQVNRPVSPSAQIQIQSDDLTCPTELVASYALLLSSRLVDLQLILSLDDDVVGGQQAVRVDFPLA